MVCFYGLDVVSVKQTLLIVSHRKIPLIYFFDTVKLHLGLAKIFSRHNICSGILSSNQQMEL